MFQTRSETTGINNFPTLDEALTHANKDSSIWKIYFTLSTNERVRLVKHQTADPISDFWIYEPVILGD